MNETKRLKRLECILRSRKVDGLIVSSPSNLFYLTGFRADGCMGLMSPQGLEVFVHPLLFNQARDCTRGAKIVNAKEDLVGAIRKSIKNQGLKRIAIEQSYVSYGLYRRFIKRFEGCSIIPGDDRIELMRMIKDEEEISLLKKSARVCKKAFSHIKKSIIPGCKENELSGRMEWYFKGVCGKDISFNTIVASGPNSAYPHHIPGKRKIKKDDIVIVDSGCRYEGYSSDLTRTFFLGNIHRLKFKKILSAVRKAQSEATGAIRPGARCRTLYDKAFRVINEAGFGRFFIHGLGHGVGIDVHEKPYMNSRSKEVLKQGMVVTVEPGIYVPGMGGVRLENMVLVTKNGHQIL